MKAIHTIVLGTASVSFDDRWIWLLCQRYDFWSVLAFWLIFDRSLRLLPIRNYLLWLQERICRQISQRKSELVNLDVLDRDFQPNRLTICKYVLWRGFEASSVEVIDRNLESQSSRHSNREINWTNRRGWTTGPSYRQWASVMRQA